MKTEDLIERLGNHLVPVRPLAPPWTRAAAWFACGGAYLGAVVLLTWVRGRSLETSGASSGAYLVQQAALVVTAVSAAGAAFASVIPAGSRRPFGAALAASAVVIATLAWGCVADIRVQGTLGAGRETDWPCVVSIALGGATFWGLAVAMLRRGAPLTPRLSSVLAGVAALSIANLEACLSRPHAFNVTILLWHGVTTALILAAMAPVGDRVLAWKTRNSAHSPRTP